MIRRRGGAGTACIIPTIRSVPRGSQCMTIRMVTITTCPLGTAGLEIGNNATTFVGTVNSNNVRWVDGGSADVETFRVDGGNQRYVWSDPGPTSRLVSQVSSSTPPQYSLVCADGTTDREVCTVTVENTDASVSYDGKTIHHQVYAESTSSAFSAGDSGGPVYSAYDEPNSNRVRAYGMVVARVSHNADNGWFTPVKYVLGAYAQDVVVKH